MKNQKIKKGSSQEEINLVIQKIKRGVTKILDSGIKNNCGC